MRVSILSLRIPVLTCVLLAVLSQYSPPGIHPTASPVAIWRTHFFYTSFTRRRTEIARHERSQGRGNGLGRRLDEASSSTDQAVGYRPKQEGGGEERHGRPGRNEITSSKRNGLETMSPFRANRRCFISVL